MKIAIINQKGGATKTETSKTLAVELSKEIKVNLVDGDPQANDTKFWKSYDGKSILDIITTSIGIKDITTKINENLNLIRSANNLSGLDIELSNRFGGERRLTAIRECGYTEISAIIRHDIQTDCDEKLAVAINNVQHEETKEILQLKIREWAEIYTEEKKLGDVPKGERRADWIAQDSYTRNTDKLFAIIN